MFILYLNKINQKPSVASKLVTGLNRRSPVRAGRILEIIKNRKR